MREIPILFSTEMVRAIMDGRKTETRRMVKPQPVEAEKGKDYWNWKIKKSCGSNIITELMSHEGFGIVTLCPYGQPGDVLWVRESFSKAFVKTPQGKEFSHFVYKADNDPLHNCHKFKPSIHMPKAAARIWLQVVEIKVERLQDITEESAKAEGVDGVEDRGLVVYKSYLANPPYHWSIKTARKSFETLWQSINAKKMPWDANPWVWVVKFKVLSTTGKPSNI